MEAGDLGEGERGNDEKSSEIDQLLHNECDLASETFKKAWLNLKEVYDKDLHRLQAKITSMREEHLSDRRQADSTAKIKELTKQHEILNSTIRDLRKQLSAKKCDRCKINESYRDELQKEMHNMQQLNLKFISGLNVQINKLREENKKLFAQIELSQQQFHVSSSDSDDDFILCKVKTKSVFEAKDPTQVAQMPGAVKSVNVQHTEQMKSGSKMELERSPKVPIPFSRDDIKVSETSFKKTPCNDGKPATEGRSCQKSSAGFPVLSTLEAQKGSGVTNLPEDKISPLKRKHETSATKTSSTKKCETNYQFPWYAFSLPPGSVPPTQLVSETSKENIPSNIKTWSPTFTKKKEIPCLNILPLDSTSKSSEKERLALGIPSSSIKVSEKDGSTERHPSAQVALKDESTCAGYGANKPQSDTRSVLSKHTPKGKVNLQ